ncbi:PDZ domain-containing protein [Roseibacillus ishigakijimensis]|uniref:PDZ domain-containing protein n=1 Tax=Roseibacillus ishigakijimensis TaxID=454146 RepID=A0A934VNI7_9BACT|nr:PDZ domain-containing protein [Roseibacillus ishigakijimensis]MBK1835085.1 PDZ domain-containing protein [Roseibacillus ishigakijimensis]
MKRFFLLFVLLTVALGAERHEDRRRGPREHKGPWLGVDLRWLEESTAAQLTNVPKGFGLLVDEVEPDSPAEAAGLQAHDVLWKLDDQLLANKWQLYALMKHTGVGNEAQLTVSRRGENINLAVTFATRPERHDEIVKAAKEVLMPPIPGDVVRHFDLGKRSGFIAEGEVTVSLTEVLDGYLYVISDGEEVRQKGTLDGPEPKDWPKDLDESTRRKLTALFQTLQNAEERDEHNPRVPRVRRVPVPEESTKK